MKKKIIWIIQPNQITPIIRDFLKTQQLRMMNFIDLSFMIPDSSPELLEKLEDLNPIPFKPTFRTATDSYQVYLAKRNRLSGNEFTHGLNFSDVLLLDDLGGGNVIHTTVDIKKDPLLCGIVTQIPTPLGSSETEERLFHGLVLWAAQHQLPIIGYELLPLDTRWLLAPSLLDGIITRSASSYRCLKENMSHNNVWLLPSYEAKIFSSVSTQFDINGTKAAYHYRNLLSLPMTRTILYLPHNVALIHEYKKLLQMLKPLGGNLHLMFSHGEDQNRGAHSHEDIIKTVYKNELNDLASYSFHPMNNLWEMTMADAVVSCAPCFQTSTADEKNIPVMIFDPLLVKSQDGSTTESKDKKQFWGTLTNLINEKKKKCELGDILMQLTIAKGQQ